MVNPLTGSSFVFIDYTKCGTADLIHHSHFLRQGFDQCGFACTHLSLKNPNFFLTCIANNLTSSVLNLIQGVINGNQEVLAFGGEMHEWHDHFLQRYTSVLKCVLIKVDIIIIVVGIGKEIILHSEYIGG